MRKDGWYWVLISAGNKTCKWVICEYFSGSWFHRGAAYRDEDFIEIDEKQIKRD